MSRELDDIKTQLSHFASKYGPATIVPATVLVVNADDTVQIEFSTGAVVDDARLRSVVKEGNRFVLVPKEGSIVQVGKIENSDEYLVIGVEEITQVRCQVDTTAFRVDAEGFLLKKGDDSLQKLIEDLFGAISRMVFTTNVGPTIKLVNQPEFDALKTRFDNFLKDS